ncbi:unnamed protein product, partial [Ixodes pacificus]
RTEAKFTGTTQERFCLPLTPRLVLFSPYATELRNNISSCEKSTSRKILHFVSSCKRGRRCASILGLFWRFLVHSAAADGTSPPARKRHVHGVMRALVALGWLTLRSERATRKNSAYLNT